MLYALIIVYNRDIRESRSFRKLSGSRDFIRLAVYDNSEKDFGNRESCEAAGCRYFSSGKNVGLAKAYNYAIRQLHQSEGSFQEDDYILIFDDDTDIGDDYLREAAELSKKAEYDIYLPIVKAGEMVISPCVLKHGCVPKLIRADEDLNLPDLSGINSGMMVRLRVFSEVSYREDMFLDFIDHAFLRQARQAGCSVAVMSSCLKQSYSREEKSGDLQAVLRRYRILKKDLFIYCRENGCRWYYLLHTGKYALRLTRRYKTFCFIRAFFSGKEKITG